MQFDKGKEKAGEYMPLAARMIPPVPGDVFIEAMPAATVGDLCPDIVTNGSNSVFINKKSAARIGDPTVQGRVVVSGFSTVLIGD